MERVEYDIKVYDNFIEIIPKEPIKDNSIYEIKLKGIKSIKGNKLEDQTLSINTAITPSYASLDSVKSLIEDCDIEDRVIALKIREASKSADLILNGVGSGISINNTDIMIPRLKEQATSNVANTTTDDNLLFAISEYVKYKATKECILKFYIRKTATAGEKGTLGDVSFEHQPKMPDIGELMKELTAQIKFWQDAMRGYGIEGRVKPKATLQGRNAIPLAVGTINSLSPVSRGYDRGV